jgi:hypothetical protein
MSPRARLTPYLLVSVLTLGAGLGVGLSLTEAPVAAPSRHAPQTAAVRPIKPHTVVHATAASAPPIGVVPTVVGLNDDEAAMTIWLAGLRPISIAVRSSTTPAGSVFAESPTPGTQLAMGSIVYVTISGGPAWPGLQSVAQEFRKQEPPVHRLGTADN